MGIEVIACVTAPVVAGSIETGRAVVDVADEVVVERSQFASPNAAVSVSALVMSGVIEALANGTPLHGEVVVVIERRHFVDAPGERAVVEYHIGIMLTGNGVSSIIDILFLSATAAYETDDDIALRL